MNSAMERLRRLKVSDVMRRDVVTLTPSETMADAAARFLEHGISGAPVVNSSNACLGILSATDFVRQGGGSLVGNERSGKQWVEAHMSRVVQSVQSDTSLSEAARIMCAGHIHRLPVLDREGRLVGLVSSLDLVAATVAAIEE